MVIDTSVFIEYLRSSNKQGTIFYKLPQNISYSISAVTLFELYSGATTLTKEKDILTLTQGIVILPFDNTVATMAATIYRKLKSENKLIEFRDIFIAATCLVHNKPLVTLNIKHFSRIKELDLF